MPKVKSANRRTKKILVLLDMHAILHRAFHALPHFSSSKGEPTGALYGFSSFLLKVLRELKPDYIAACYDLPGPTFRHAAYEKYKIKRPEVDPELKIQLNRSYDIVSAFSIPFFENPRFEADDIIGTLVEKAKREKDLEVIIASGDLDTLQLAQGTKVKVFTLKKGIKDTVIYDEKKVKERFGFSPGLLPDFKGLKGDPSDNIIGIPGIGDKTASELIAKFGSLEKIFKILKKDKKALEKRGIKERTIKLLEEYEEEALFSKTLASIRKDAPIDFSLEELNWRKNYKKEDTQELFKELGFSSLIERLPFPNIRSQKEKIKIGRQIKTEKNPEFLKEAKKIWWYPSEEKKLYALAFPERIFVFEPERDKVFLKEIFSHSQEHIFYDAKLLLHFLSDYKMEPEIKKDLKIMAWLSRPELQNPNLRDTLSNFLPNELKIDTQILDELLLLPQLEEILDRELRGEKLEKVFFELELPLIKILYQMEKNGINIDRKLLKNLKEEVRDKAQLLESKIYKLAGKTFNIKSPLQVGEIFVEKLGLKAFKKTKTGRISTRERELLKLKDKLPLAGLILEHRELSKLSSTYLEPFLMFSEKDSKIHTTFNQCGTVTGRLSSEEPNLQNLPAKSGLGRKIRDAFVASDGFSFAAFDYQQIELKILAAFANDQKMLKAFRAGIDIHKLTASEINNVPLEKVTSQMRDRAKTINFGIIYGMGIRQLSLSTGLTTDEAQRFYDEYFNDFPFVSRYIERIKGGVRKRGYTETLFGRKRFFDFKKIREKYLESELERQAVNAVIQGSDADIVKCAMIAVSKNFDLGLVRPLLQVHDELVYEIKDDIIKEVAPKLKNLMEGVVDISVPLSVEVKIGKRLGSLKPYES